jgi:hypothetical protein
MSVESKIQELLERVNVKASLDEASAAPMQGDSKSSTHAGPMGASTSKDTTLKAKNSGDSSSPKQGDSEDASYESRGEQDANQGAITAKGISKNSLTAKGPGAAPNFTTVKDLSSIPQNTGIHEEDVTAEDEELMSEEEYEDEDNTVTEEEVVAEQEKLDIDISTIFGDDLSEEFKNKASSIFEAAVIAKVNDEMERVTEALEERYAAEFEDYKEGMVERVDAYLNYVVENYMEENKLAVENGLRTEIAEDFMTGLKALFKEHYIEVPEEKYDVIGELQDKVSELEESLNQQFENNVDLNSEVSVLKKALIIKEMSDDLADTEVNKLTKLLEGVEFENEDIYMEKVAVIKENYFPSNANKETLNISQAQPLLEDTSVQEDFGSTNDVVSSYAKALTRTIKRV